MASSRDTRGAVGFRISLHRTHVIVDAHELPGPPRLYDFYTLGPHNLNGPAETERFTKERAIPAVVEAVEAAGYTHFVYHTPGDVTHHPEEGLSGGSCGAPTLTAYGGARGAISILYETLRSGDARIGIERRTGVQRLAMEALAVFIADHRQGHFRATPTPGEPFRSTGCSFRPPRIGISHRFREVLQDVKFQEVETLFSDRAALGNSSSEMLILSSRPVAHPGPDHDHAHDEPHNDIVYPDAIPFVIVHLACFGILWSGVTTTALVMCVTLYVVRMFAITGGFHRYFSHRSYRTSRAFQFFMAFLGQSSAQKGVLWWAAIHRHHHLHSDTEHDVHSPRHTGFFFSHVGWIFSPQKNEADYSTIKDFTKYPELVFINRYPHIPAVMLAVATYLVGGWPGLFVGFFLSTVILYHGTFAINSLAHVIGKQRYVTGDDSRNNWWLAIITLGEGWHNNHHAYQSSTRQGFRWYEIDITFYVLTMLSWLGVVRDLRSPPREIVTGEQRLGRKVLEKVAHELAASFSIERMSAEVQEAWASIPSLPSLDELKERAEKTRSQAAALLAEVHLPELPHLPSVDELKARAGEMYADSPSLDEIALRAREIILEAVSLRLLEEQGLAG